MDAQSEYLVERGQATAFAGQPQVRLDSAPERRSRSILLVDDTPEVLEVLRYFLIRAGFEVVVCTSAKAALEMSRTGAEPFGLLITDLKLGEGQSGIELAETLTAFNPALAVVYMSGARADLWDPSLFVEGVNYLPKPFSPAVLVRIAQERLG